MNELKNIVKDIRSGELPATEIPNFALYLIARNIGKVSAAIVIGFALFVALR